MKKILGLITAALFLYSAYYVWVNYPSVMPVQTMRPHHFTFHGAFISVFVVILLLFFLMTFNQNHEQSYTEHSALSQLKKRYVKGEIDKETYQHMKKTLEEE